MTANTGGRITFQPNSEVRILCSDGRISNEVYTVESEKSDRKGLVIIKDSDTSKLVKVQFRRIIPVNSFGKAAVIESGGKCRAVCPKCNYVEVVNAATEHLCCPSHGLVELYWLGVKPMTEVAVKKEKPPKEKPAKVEKEPKAVRKPTAVDLHALSTTQHCELWSRNANFDHERVDAVSHTLLYVGTHPRKFCFNTYNGMLGKNANALPIDSFIHDKPVDGKKPWYAVADLDKTRAKLQKEGYELRKK